MEQSHAGQKYLPASIYLTVTPPARQRAALSFLPVISGEAILKARELPPVAEAGEADSFAVAENGAKVSQAEFAEAYLRCVDRIAGEARRLILSGKTLRELRIAADDSNSSGVREDGGLSPRSEWKSRQNSYESCLRSEILRLAAAQGTDPELTVRARNLAIIALQRAEREERLQSLMKQPGTREKLQRYADFMDEARSRAGTGADGSTVLSHFVRVVRERTGTTPALRVISDFDGNLTRVAESGSPWKPGEKTNLLINKIDKAAGLGIAVRMATTECPGTLRDMRQRAADLYNIAAEESHLFWDASGLFRRLHASGCDHVILTGNHRKLVEAKLGPAAFMYREIIGMDENYWYPDKAEEILMMLLETRGTDVFLVSDDRDSTLCRHLNLSEKELSETYAGLKYPLSRLVFFASREGKDGSEERLARVLRTRGIPHGRNCPDGDYGLNATIAMVEAWQEAAGLNVMRPIITGDYKTGDVIRQCRELPGRSRLYPVPEIKTIIRPFQHMELGNGQYDLGVPTAVYVPGSDEWVVLYKAANAPSQSVDPKAPRAVSNVFAARYNPSSGRVVFFDRKSAEIEQGKAGPLLMSIQPEPYSTDGLHDPRVTWVPSLQKAIITACAFNKDIEKKTIKEAGGCLSKRISGAWTEAFETDNPLDPASYRSLGRFGPDFHFKNMVFFPAKVKVDGEDSLLLLIREMPGIQLASIPLELFKEIGSDSSLREQFWKLGLHPEVSRNNRVMNPVLPHEGFGNPYSPGKKGQLAPGIPPVEVNVRYTNGASGKAWLMIYNSVPDYKADMGADGRVICAALLDYSDPKLVIARGPHPVIIPRTCDEVLKEGVAPRHANVAFCGGGGVDKAGRLSVFYTEDDSIIRVATWESADQLAQSLMQFDAYGRLRYGAGSQGVV